MGVGVLAVSVVPARIQMGASLGFHIVLACFGIAAPTAMLVAHWIGIRRGNPAALLLARRWAKVNALLFAVGAVSGTVLSYEMGLLWPGLMGRFGSSVGVGFSVEAVWFFVEAVFVSIYLYGWRRLPPWLHWWSGVPAAVGGIFGAWAVVSVNSWMNTPQGYVERDGQVVNVRPAAVFFNSASAYEVPHMILAAYMVTGFVVAGVYATGMLRGRTDPYHRLGFLIPFWMAAVAAPVQVFVGDVAARLVARQQPVKFAAMEYVAQTQQRATEWLGGIYHNGDVWFGVGVPWLDSILVGYSPHTTVTGWETVPPDQRPNLVTLIHLSFNLMVLTGLILMTLAAWQGWYWWYHRRLLRTRWFLVPMALSGLSAVAAMEAGWVVTEVGRQPWVVYQVQKVADAATTAAGVPVTLATIFAIYLVMTAVSIAVPHRMSVRWRRQDHTSRQAATAPGTPPPPAEGVLTG